MERSDIQGSVAIFVGGPDFAALNLSMAKMLSPSKA